MDVLPSTSASECAGSTNYPRAVRFALDDVGFLPPLAAISRLGKLEHCNLVRSGLAWFTDGENASLFDPDDPRHEVLVGPEFLETLGVGP